MHSYSVVDLFAGCGGLSSGFHATGFTISDFVENSAAAVRTYAANFSTNADSPKAGDVRNYMEARDQDVDVRPPDVLIGGPPCQAYSRVGRGKLNSLGVHRHFLQDDRGFLFDEFLRVAMILQPSVILMENVTDSINWGGINIPDRVSTVLIENGYEASWTVLNAADYGVPQTRERVFVVARKPGIHFEWPAPTHQKGDDIAYQTRDRQRLATACDHFDMVQLPSSPLPSWITVEEAISDLPVLHPSDSDKYRPRPVNAILPYRTPPESPYQELMRARSSPAGTVNHVYRNTKRDFATFARMKPGDNYVDAVSIAKELVSSRIEQSQLPDDPVLRQNLEKRVVPPYDPAKFHDKWKRLRPDRPSHTVTAHLSTDTYSHIHPIEPRGISVREAARLQSFPDDFWFVGNIGDAFRQIGNSVPPLLSQAIARAIYAALSRGNS